MERPVARLTPMVSLWGDKCTQYVKLSSVKQMIVYARILTCGMRYIDVEYHSLSYPLPAGNVNVVNALLMAGADGDLNKVTKAGTPLVCAASGGHQDAALALIWAGADVNMVNSMGSTALMHAAHNGDAEMVNALLLNGADTQIRNEVHMTPFVTAFYLDYVDVVSVFLTSRAFRSSSSLDLTVKLFSAASNGSASIGN